MSVSLKKLKELQGQLDYFKENFDDGVFDFESGFGFFGGHLDIACHIAPRLIVLLNDFVEDFE